MNKLLLLITIAILSAYSGSQAAAHNSKSKERAQEKIAALRAEMAQKSVAELKAEAAANCERLRLYNPCTSSEQTCSALHSRNCAISEILRNRSYANEAEKVSLVTEMQQNLEYMRNPVTPRENLELSSRNCRISERLYELEKLNNADKS